jgi:hypothetical protein
MMTATAMTADEFERLDELQAEAWIAWRFRQFVSAGFPPDLSLMFAVHPDVCVPAEAGPAEPYAEPRETAA